MKTQYRRSIRLKGYDFVTLCTYQKQCLFGEISHGKMILNRIGKIVAQEWERSPQMRLELEHDEWVIMPNHLHGIVMITETHTNGGGRTNVGGRPHGMRPPSTLLPTENLISSRVRG